MQLENAIEVKNITKKFKVFLDKGNTLKEKMLFCSRRKYETRIVLDDISFQVKKGEAIGLIGKNGCGKSTTLKLLTRIMYPDSGSIEMCGRVSSLIELGAGFHPDMSGRQNIYTNASIFGLTHKEIENRFDDIVAFSELEQFIDNPVRTYSSGMYMRLAFSVAINVEAEILLIDEILAVGDTYFQTKCFNKLREMKSKGTTIVIVSHSLGQIEQICERSIWINDARIKMEGIPAEVHSQYLNYMEHQRTDKIPCSTFNDEVIKELYVEIEKPIVKSIEIIKAELLHNNENDNFKFKVGEIATLKIFYEKHAELDSPFLDIRIYRNDNVDAYEINTSNEKINLALTNSGYIECVIPQLNLVAGEYYIDLAFKGGDIIVYDYKEKVVKFETYYTISETGISHLKHDWNFVEGDRI